MSQVPDYLAEDLLRRLQALPPERGCTWAEFEAKRARILEELRAQREGDDDENPELT